MLAFRLFCKYFLNYIIICNLFENGERNFITSKCEKVVFKIQMTQILQSIDPIDL